jgi:hypothetical protein
MNPCRLKEKAGPPLNHGHHYQPSFSHYARLWRHKARETRACLGNALGTENCKSTFGQQLLKPQEDHTPGRAKKKLMLSDDLCQIFAFAFAFHLSSTFTSRHRRQFKVCLKLSLRPRLGCRVLQNYILLPVTVSKPPLLDSRLLNLTPSPVLRMQRGVEEIQPAIEDW